MISVHKKVNQRLYFDCQIEIEKIYPYDHRKSSPGNSKIWKLSISSLNHLISISINDPIYENLSEEIDLKSY